MNTCDAITNLIFARDAPTPVDWAMVLGCPSITNMDPALDLYRQGLTRNILITGHGPTDAGEPEWRRYREYALARGVPASAMLIEPDARNTRDNFIFSERLLAQEAGWHSIAAMAIITKPIHARRALMTARQYFPAHVALTMLSPFDAESIQPATWWQSPHGRERVLGELRKIGEYGVKGHLGDF
jgi:uncharacterized SAM-binding protein YcdF (DUF218 family)